MEGEEIHAYVLRGCGAAAAVVHSARSSAPDSKDRRGRGAREYVSGQSRGANVWAVWEPGGGAAGVRGHRAPQCLLLGHFDGSVCAEWAIARIRGCVSQDAGEGSYAQNGHIDEAQEIFHRAPSRDIVTWNTIAAALAQLGSSAQSREFFNAMPERNEISWSCTIQSIAQAGNSHDARALLDRMPRWSVFALNALIAASATGSDEAQELFDQMPHRDVATWTALMDAYARAGLLRHSRRVFAEMPVRNVFSWTVLIVAVARGGIDGGPRVEESRSLFDRMPARNLVAWNATIAAFGEYAPHLSGLFVSIPARDAATWNSLVRGFGHSGEIARAEEILSKMPHHGLLAWNSMLVAYAHSGHLEKAYLLFGAMPVRDRFSWSAALSWDYRRFWEMGLEGIEPDPVCVTSLLASLKDAGDLQSSREWFVRMLPDFGIQLTKDHFYCIADGLAKSGELSLAIEFLAGVPFDPDVIAWTTILSSCVEFSDASLGAHAAERVLGDSRNYGGAGAFISLANTYSMMVSFDPP
ncbi:pentatricopeptide repeat-containing protein At4g02750 [Selaginella moellendorffii]|nr:pentatricopeptide repeat-containing protein At4g02750 [Selaginella moellendorffii]|eukprot:XP_024545381.1 pentatricopeptide repeat-containing protein At4g02750 [Selaginella moellendorffii]